MAKDFAKTMLGLLAFAGLLALVLVACGAT